MAIDARTSSPIKKISRARSMALVYLRKESPGEYFTFA